MDKTGAYSRVEHMKGASLWQALTLPTHIRLGWKGLPGTNTSLFQKSVNYGSKKFIELTQVWNPLKVIQNCKEKPKYTAWEQ